MAKEAKRYAGTLMEKINADREKHRKKPFDDDDHDEPLVETKTVSESTTNPDSGVFHKDEHQKCFAYEAHTVCDRHNFVLDMVVTPENIHNSMAFNPLYDELTAHYPELKTIITNAAYKKSLMTDVSFLLRTSGPWPEKAGCPGASAVMAVWSYPVER